MGRVEKDRQCSLATYSILTSRIVVLLYPLDTHNLQEAFSKPVLCASNSTTVHVVFISLPIRNLPGRHQDRLLYPS